MAIPLLPNSKRVGAHHIDDSQPAPPDEAEARCARCHRIRVLVRHTDICAACMASLEVAEAIVPPQTGDAVIFKARRRKIYFPTTGRYSL